MLAERLALTSPQALIDYCFKRYSVLLSTKLAKHLLSRLLAPPPEPCVWIKVQLCRHGCFPHRGIIHQTLKYNALHIFQPGPKLQLDVLFRKLTQQDKWRLRTDIFRRGREPGGASIQYNGGDIYE